MIEKLIEAVRDHEVLYDTSHPDYQKARLKDQIWSGIAAELNLEEGNEAKTIWIKLRNCHRDALRRQKRLLGSGTPTTAIKQWKFQKDMEFLIPYMTNRLREGSSNDDSGCHKDTEHQYMEQAQVQCEELDIGNFKTENAHGSEEMEEILEGNPRYMVQAQVQCEGLKIENVWSENAQDREEMKEIFNIPDVDIEENTMETPKPTFTKKIKRESISRRERRVQELGRKKMKKTPSTDHLYHFFLSMYELTKQMPTSLQHSVRNDVFHAVSQAEAEYLQIQRPHQGRCQTDRSSCCQEATPLPSSSNSIDLIQDSQNIDSTSQQAVTQATDGNPPSFFEAIEYNFSLEDSSD